MIRLAAILLLACLALQPVQSRAAGGHEPGPKEERLLGLTRTQLALAVATGAGIGVLAAGGNSLFTAGAGTLAAIYVAHMVVEAVAIGGMLYLWPEDQAEPETSPRIKLGRPVVRGRLQMAASLTDLESPEPGRGTSAARAAPGP